MTVLFYMLVHLPIALPIGMLGYGLAEGAFRMKAGPLQKLMRALLILFLIGLSVGVVYGVLRFSGVIMKTGDNGMSVNDLDASWRDDGFDHFYWCGMPLLGALIGMLRGGKCTRAVA